MNKSTAIVKNILADITARGIVAELQHTQNGLFTTTLLVSATTNLSWEVVSRVLFDNVTVHIIFPGESYDFLYRQFKSPSELSNLVQQVKDKEDQHIFQYFLKSIGHNILLNPGDELIISPPITHAV